MVYHGNPDDGLAQQTVGCVERETVLAALQSGPMSASQLGVAVPVVRALEAEGAIAIDADAFPGEYVPGNPLIARLPCFTAATESTGRDQSLT